MVLCFFLCLRLTQFLSMKTIVSFVAASALAMAFASCTCETKQSVKVPYQKNEYVHVYSPTGKIFQGPDVKYFKEGEYYEKWLANDHTIIKGKDGKWHMFGLIFPNPENVKQIHNGGSQSFHAVSSTPLFKESFVHNGWECKDQVLTRNVTNHSPYIVEKDGLYYMIYGNSTVVLATSKDLYNWNFEGELFKDDSEKMRDLRDPNVIKVGDTYYLSHCVENGVAMRSSKDLRNWSASKVVFRPEEYDPESPSVIFYDGRYYLFVCVWNKHKMLLQKVDNAFPQITNVYVSDKVEGPYEESSLVATLNGHAPEIFQDEDGDWYISSAQYPYRGVSIDRLFWK